MAASGTAGPGVTAPRRRTSPWVGLVPLVVGVAFLIVAVLMGRSELRYGQEGVSVQATILRLWVDESENSDGDTTYSYRVGYEFVERLSGHAYRGSGDVGEFRYYGLSVGEAIEVSYLASDAAENRLGNPEPQLFLRIGVGAFAVVLLLVSPLIVVSAIRAGRLRRTSVATEAGGAGDLRRVDVFTRSPYQAAGGPLASMFGVASLAVAAFGLSQAGNMPSLLVLTLFGTVVGIGLMAAGVTSLRRGLGLKLAEVGPDGIWLLGLGRVAWADLAEIRVEAPPARVSSESGEGASAPTASAQARLGVVPRDPALAARRPDRLGRTLGRAFFGFLNTVQPRARLVTESDQAPFGVTAAELDQPFEELLASARRFMPIGTRVVAPMGTADESSSTPSGGDVDDD
jgi:hypothetical protein